MEWPKMTENLRPHEPETEFLGKSMYKLLAAMFPICRSLTGDGVRESLRIIQEIIPNLKVVEVATGEVAFDWKVPREWNISEAYIETMNGVRVIDFKNNNLHVVGYSDQIDAIVSREDLAKHIYTLKNRPQAIPYVTSYYERNWGFCTTVEQLQQLTDDRYHVVIRSTLTEGYLTYAEMILPGKSSDEILLSTYVCHPSMANNELSGPSVVTYLADWLSHSEDRYFTYRIVFIPETIGSIVYLSRNLEPMKRHTKAGFVVTCAGDNRAYSFLPSRLGSTLADRVSLHVMQHEIEEFTKYSYLERGSDERQYCSPGVDLPVVSIMRSKYDTYPEYHTSDDNLDLVTEDGLLGTYILLKRSIQLLEVNGPYVSTVLCEPQMGSRGIYPTLSTSDSAIDTWPMMNVLAYCDGDHDLIEIAEIMNCYAIDLIPIVQLLLSHNLIRHVTETVQDRKKMSE